MDEDSHNKIASLLESSGIKFRSTAEYFQTFWKDKYLQNLIIICFDDKNWVNISSVLDIGRIKKANSQKVDLELINQLNTIYPGMKFLKDKLNHYIILSQIQIEFLSSEYLMSTFKQMVQIVNDLYD